MLFVERLGKDLTIERIPAAQDEPTIEVEGMTFKLLHRVNSSFEGTPVGRAATSWSGTDEAWQKIKGIRMSQVLREHGVRIVECEYDENAAELHRKMLSKVGEDCLLVEEWLLLEPVSAALNKKMKEG